ncbi:hypothetical protein FJT64_000697 [Amphibalanus amphitrite]|uniref:Uncharacterized protein n=1 Tax=Amphibalanus amphitrite TaxID=1232801 RepID=A0A6A4VF38_AMPAM|nr:hypothetical protein FJT64_000697 [Amphibalanus amphitrite]
MYRVVLWEQVRLTEHLRALETVFGYVLHGRDDVPVCQPMKYALRCSRLQTQDFRPEQLWSLETLGITAEEEKAGPSAIPRWSDADQSRGEAESSMKRTEKIFSDAGMELHKLHITGDDTGAEAHVLGLRWCTSSDRLAAVDRLAWMRRFISNCRLQRTERMTGPLTPEERMLADDGLLEDDSPDWRATGAHLA